MHKRVDERPRRTPLEEIKEHHERLRGRISDGQEDEIEWDRDVSPEQVGLRTVWCDDNYQMWTMVRRGDKLFLHRILISDY